MSNLPPLHSDHGDYERQDLNTRGPMLFLGGMVLFGIFTYFMIVGMLRLLNGQNTRGQSAANPMATSVPADTRHVQPGEIVAFPEPRLEEDERGQLNGVRLKEEQTLNSYGYIDEKAGVVHIPIERAMQLMVEHGLPQRSAGATAPATEAAKPAAAAKKKLAPTKK